MQGNLARFRHGLDALWERGDREEIQRILASLVSQLRPGRGRLRIRVERYGTLGFGIINIFELLGIAVRSYARLERHDLALEVAEIGVLLSQENANWVAFKVDALVALNRRDEAVSVLRSALHTDERGLLSSRLDDLFPAERELH